MIELLFLFAFWPWALVLAFVIICAAGAWAESTIIGLASLVVFSGIAWFFYEAGPVALVIEQPWNLFAIVGVYGAVGALWSLFKWRNWMVRDIVQDALKTAKDNYLKEGDTFISFINSNYFPDISRASMSKDRIVSWISLWPFSAFLYVFDDLILRFFTRIYDLFSGIYDRITERYLPK